MTSTIGHRHRRRQPAAAPATPDPGVRWPHLTGALLVAVVLAAAALAGIAPLLSPAPQVGDPGVGFSLDRARADLAVVSAVPHPMGSSEQSSVEAYLVQQLDAAGLQPEVDEQTVTMTPDAPRSVWTGRVRNVVARIEGAGPDADQAVLLAAHYDSVPTSPGAGDNGAGVVSVLAAVRSLASGTPPRHDVVAAFVDGEEHEMLGSLALVESADWMRDVQVAVNTEGIGNAGRVTPALTAPDNGWALRQYLAAVPSPVVYSGFDAPLNATGQGADLGRYQDVVPAGLELVVVGGLPAYHAGTDTAANMHQGTLAEYGTTVVALARQLADADLASVQAPDLVAFTLTDGVTVAYPSTWSVPLALVAALAVVVVIGLAVRRSRVTLGRVVLSWLGLGLAGLVGVLAGTALWLAVRAVDPRLSDALNGGVYDRTAYVLAAVTAGAAGVLLAVRPLRRRCRPLEVVGGALVGWSLVALLLAVVLPDAAYAATWPLIAATAGFALVAIREPSARTTAVVTTVAAVPAVVLLSPLVVLYFALAARFELMLPVATPLPMLWVVLALTLVVPLVLLVVSRVGWRPAAAAGALAVVLAATGLAMSSSSDGPRPDLLVHHVDADTGTARWVALPQTLDTHTGQVGDGRWMPSSFESSPFHQPWETETGSTLPAPALPPDTVSTPQVTVTTDVAAPQGRELILDILPPPGSYALTVDVTSGAGVQGIAVNGKAMPDATAGTPRSVRVVAFSPTGSVPLTVTVPAGADVELALGTYTRGFDSIPGLTIKPRPASLTTAGHEVPDGLLVTSTARLPGQRDRPTTLPEGSRRRTTASARAATTSG